MAYKVLYISYDGMTDPLGQSQVIPYLKVLSKNGYKITLLSFEKKEKLEKLRSQIQAIVDEAGISWHPLLFTRRPPLLSKIYDVWNLQRNVRQLHSKTPFDLIHCRSYVPASAGLKMWKRYKIPFLFDMRGFWVDERVDNGQWDLKNPFFRFFYKRYKKKEAAYFSNARHIISLTWKGKEELVNRYGVPADKVTVIPCCVDLQHFDYHKIDGEELEKRRSKLNISNQDVIISYLGSLGGWYLQKEMMDFFKALKEKMPNAKFLIITQDTPALIYQAAVASRVTEESIVIQAAQRNEVPYYLAMSDYCLFFIKDAYSKRASSPTKQGEIMAMGIPLICNDIGDTGKIIEDSGAGLLIKQFTESCYRQVIDEMPGLLKKDRVEIRKAAFKYYDLSTGASSYIEVYNRLLNQ